MKNLNFSEWSLFSSFFECQVWNSRLPNRWIVSSKVGYNPKATSTHRLSVCFKVGTRRRIWIIRLTADPINWKSSSEPTISSPNYRRTTRNSPFFEHFQDDFQLARQIIGMFSIVLLFDQLGKRPFPAESSAGVPAAAAASSTSGANSEPVPVSTASVPAKSGRRSSWSGGGRRTAARSALPDAIEQYSTRSSQNTWQGALERALR